MSLHLHTFSIGKNSYGCRHSIQMISLFIEMPTFSTKTWLEANKNHYATTVDCGQCNKLIYQLRRPFKKHGVTD